MQSTNLTSTQNNTRHRPYAALARPDKIPCFDITSAMHPLDAAAQIGKSSSYLQSLRAQNEGPPYWSFGNRTFYMPEDLKDWIASCRVQPTG